MSLPSRYAELLEEIAPKYPLIPYTYVVGGKIVVEVGEMYLELPTTTIPLIPGTTYTLPPLTGYYFDLTTWKTKAFIVYADQPVDVQVEESIDGEDFYDVEGLSIASADFVTNKWNSIVTDTPLKYIRLKATTGATAPTKMILVVRAFR